MENTKDKLDFIFEKQKQFGDELIEKRNLPNFSKQEWMQKLTLAMLSELAELLDEVNFKWWKNEKPIDDDLLKNEIVDLLHFLVDMCLKSGMDSKEVFERYLEKNKENFNRQEGKSLKKGYDINSNE